MLIAVQIVFLVFIVLFYLSSMGAKDEKKSVIYMAGAIANALLFLGSVAIGGQI